MNIDEKKYLVKRIDEMSKVKNSQLNSERNDAFSKKNINSVLAVVDVFSITGNDINDIREALKENIRNNIMGYNAYHIPVTKMHTKISDVLHEAWKINAELNNKITKEYNVRIDALAKETNCVKDHIMLGDSADALQAIKDFESKTF